MTRLISRRDLMAEAAVAAAAGGLLASPALARRTTRTVRTQVAVLGGGMGGLAAAHELAERGFAVTVVEPKVLGGKARSIPVAGTGTGGRKDLPGEHGFRFFPGFYKNIPDTMRRIGVIDHLVDANQELLIFDGTRQLYATPSLDANGPLEGAQTLATAIGIAAGVPANELEYFVRKLLVFLTSCDARRAGEWEYVAWWEYTNAAKFSPEYQRAFGTGLTKDLVAAKGAKASTRTVGLMAEAFVYSLLAELSPEVRRESGYGAADRLLDAPTSEAWIDPWVAHLRSLGVKFVTGRRATSLKLENGRIVAAGLRDAKNRHTRLEADWFVCAMPVERMVPLLNSKVLAAAPELGRLHRLETDWMNGVQFFLNRPTGIPVHGHVAFLESPWALTSIDQGLFWRADIAKTYGDGSVTDIYSVDISDFFAPGVLYGKPASQCTPQEIAAEVWAQMKQALNTTSKAFLSDDQLVRWFLDPAIHYPDGPDKPAANDEPLLINTAGSLDDRPNAQTSIPNLLLASDYVRTNVDLATMEGANEAGRQAANAILAATSSPHPPATLGTLWQPAQLDGLREIDAQRYRAHQPNALDGIPASIPL
jgi:uncharacterized protein with NAD-binding domain and iron-sulfur cluster